MCGIAGFVPFGKQQGIALDNKAKKMHEAISHRGPDDCGIFKDENGSLVLAHRRLSIIDLSAAGHQPMLSASGRYIIVFNGEIYNFLELRKQFEQGGFNFKGHSDTEVLLAAIDQWGVAETMPHINGMFALAVYDLEAKKLYFARDRLGKKPLYVGWGKDGFYFASELKAILAGLPERPELNRNAADSYFWWRYVPEPLCIYDGFHKIPPGHIWSISIQDLQTPHHPIPDMQSYWPWEDRIDNEPYTGSKEDALDHLDHLLRQAVERRLVADVPLGSFLSGGIDSSLIVSLMQNMAEGGVRSYSVAFDEDGVNEADIARSVATHLGTQHTELKVTARDALEAVDQISGIYDEPLADPSAIPVYLLCKLAREQITVAFSGDGGDETFGGYGQYAKARKLALLPFFIRQVLQISGSNIPTSSPKFLKLMSLLAAPNSRSLHAAFGSYRQTVPDFLKHDMPGRSEPLLDSLNIEDLSPSRAMMLCDSLMFLPGLVLPKVDRASMACSMEIRSPLLDQNVIEFGWHMPNHWMQNKSMLRTLLKRYVPEELINRPKHPFLIPHGQWLKGELREWAEDLLSETSLEKSGVLKKQAVRSIWTEHISGRHNHQDVLWTIIQFQNWYKRWME